MAKQTVNIGTIPNDGTGDVLRTAFDKLNDNFDEVYAFTGGAQYVDGTYTVGSPLSITSGSRVKITCDNNTIIDGDVPAEFTSGMWDATTNTLQAVRDKDRFVLEVRFKAKNSVNNGHFDIEIDIGGGIGVIGRVSENFTRSANTEQSFKPVFVYFTGSTFISNGGEIYIDAKSGNLEIYDIEILPTRVHRGL